MPLKAVQSNLRPAASEIGARPLDETVELTEVGVSIYDANLHLIFCNPSFRRIFDLPEDKVPLGSPLAPIVRSLAANGAYGTVDIDAFVAQLLSTLKKLDQPLIMERRVADGRIFESTTSRLPGGGCLAIHTDITRHKATQERLLESQRQLCAQTNLLQTSIDNMPGALAVWDSDLRYLLWSRQGEDFFNLPPGTLKVGMHLSEVVRLFAERGDYGPGDVETLVEQQMRPFHQRESVVVSRHMPDGRVIQSHRNPLPDGGYVSVFRDISEQKRLEAELRHSQKQLKALLDSSGQGFLSFGRDLRVQAEFSQACLAVFGRNPSGQPLPQLLMPDDIPGAATLRVQLQAFFNSTTQKQARQRLSALPQEFLLGEHILQADFRPLEDGDLMLVLTDISAERRLAKLSNTDRLTGLANRRKLDEHLSHEYERAARSGLPLAMIIADIDHFKQINDSRGHLAGDRVLSGVALTLRERIRKSDWLGRWGGEEFMLICPNTDAAGAGRLAEELRQALRTQPISQEAVTCSFGIAVLTPGETLDAWVERADRALYDAKHHGRDRVTVAA